MRALKHVRIFPTYKHDHKVGMIVPKGGSSCVTCHYLSADKKLCTEDKWYKWNYNDPTLPAPPDQYCCDFYKPKESATTLKKYTG